MFVLFEIPYAKKGCRLGNVEVMDGGLGSDGLSS
jgi:hypothetical protein